VKVFTKIANDIHEFMEKMKLIHGEKYDILMRYELLSAYLIRSTR
jgi:hypothetical protein